jgi:hypothetical protein
MTPKPVPGTSRRLFHTPTNYRSQILGTTDAITDTDFLARLNQSSPLSYPVTVQVQLLKCERW